MTENTAAKRFAEKIVLITGPSDQGIGGAIAERFAAEGASIALLCFEVPRKLVRRLERSGTPLVLCEGDVTRSGDIERLVQQCLEKWGKIDVVINNAGVDMTCLIAETPDEAWERIININLSGAMRVSRAVVPHLTRPGGVVVSIASATASAPAGGLSAYSASKAALIAFTKSLAQEVAKHKIRAVSVSPGLVLTPMTIPYLSRVSPARAAQIQFTHPLGVGTPSDVAAAVAFLASDEARWITGVDLPLGWQAAMPLGHDEPGDAKLDLV